MPLLGPLHRYYANRNHRLLRDASLAGEEPTFPGLVSQLCTVKQMQSPEYLHWCEFLKCSNETLHRKVWEYCYIVQVIKEQLGFSQGLRGLGFGVGRDRLAESFAALGCHVVATDQAPEHAEQKGWTKTNQYATTLDDLNRLRICPPELFRERVRFEVADMNQIPKIYMDFDFVWSACAFEHLGSIEHGLTFVTEAMRCLRVGGWAVHTTEYNLASNEDTVTRGGTVLFRRKDLDELGRRLQEQGHRLLPLNTHPGSDSLDHHVDVPPYPRSPHLRLLIARYAATSIGIAVQRIS